MLLQNIFVHHVHFWLKDKADLPKLIEGLNLLLPIPFIKHIQIGVPANTHREVVDRSYDASLLILFEDQIAHDAYQIDSTHQVFATQYAMVLCNKVVVQDSVDA